MIRSEDRVSVMTMSDESGKMKKVVLLNGKMEGIHEAGKRKAGTEHSVSIHETKGGVEKSMQSTSAGECSWELSTWPSKS